MQLVSAFMENFITQICIKRVILKKLMSVPNSVYGKHLLLIKTDSRASLLDFWCTSLALLKLHLHTEMYDDTWFSYFINLLAYHHEI